MQSLKILNQINSENVVKTKARKKKLNITIHKHHNPQCDSGKINKFSKMKKPRIKKQTLTKKIPLCRKRAATDKNPDGRFPNGIIKS